MIYYITPKTRFTFECRYETVVSYFIYVRPNVYILREIQESL